MTETTEADESIAVPVAALSGSPCLADDPATLASSATP